MEKRPERTKTGEIASLIGLGCNILLALGKVIIGSSAGLISVVADGINNLSDASAGVVNLIGFRLAARPADDEHPLGHARYEYISGFIVSLFVLVAGIELLKSSAEKILRPAAAESSPLVLGLLAASIAVKLFMAFIYKRADAKIRSETLRAAAEDSRNDCIATGAVLVSALILRFARVNIDGYMGAAVALFVLYEGIGLLRDTIRPLLGTMPDTETVRHIEEKIRSYDGVLGAHDLMIHDYGPDRCFASVHVEVPGEQSVYECHKLIDEIEQDFLRDDGIHLVIHADPVSGRSSARSAEDELQHYLTGLLRPFGGKVTVHDLRILHGTDVSFDCVIPADETDREHEICDFLIENLKRRDPDYTVAIKIDHSIVSIE